jgi:hypothetical protein
LDDDDEWLPGNMQAQLTALEAHPRAAFAYGVAQCATANLEPLPWLFPTAPLASGLVAEQLHLDYPNLGVVLFRREAFEEVNGFDVSMGWWAGGSATIVRETLAFHGDRQKLAPSACEDGDLMLRIAVRNEIVGVESVGMLYRLKNPSRARADFHWAIRSFVHWKPQGIGWRTNLLWQYKQRGGLYRKFCQDTAACISGGQREDAWVSFTRALRIAPLHAIRHPRLVWPLIWRICGPIPSTSA